MTNKFDSAVLDLLTSYAFKMNNKHDVVSTIQMYLDSCEKAVGTPARIDIAILLIDYLCQPVALQFIHDHPKFQCNVVAKMHAFKSDPVSSPELIAKATALLALIVPSTLVIAEDAPAMLKATYSETVKGITDNMRRFEKEDPDDRRMLAFYKEEFLAFLERADVIAFLKADHPERLDIRAFLRWMIDSEPLTSSIASAVRRYLERIPM